MMRFATASLAALMVMSSTNFAHAQAAAQAGTLVVTVVDTTGAVLPGATVKVVGLEPANKSAAIAPVIATADGIATIQKLAPGRYSVQAEFSGFETRMLPDVRIRGGNNKQVLMLPIEGRKETVLVGQDKQAAAADPRGNSFGTQLTREQLDALSDDPDLLRQQLQDMAGPGAVFKIDSFEGGALPTKAQIRSIRISRDQFAAEYHNAGGVSIEIITQPGLGPLRMNVGYRFRGDNLSGTSPFTPERGPEQFQTLFLGGGGTLIKNKSSFNIFFNGADSYETPNINVALADGRTRSEAMRLRSPRQNYNVNANVDYALTLNQTLRFGLFMLRNHNRNLGIGQWDEETRAYDNENTNGQFRAQQIGPLGRRGFLRTRLQYAWNDSDSTARVEIPTTRVLDAFTRGGAQVSGGQHSKTVTLGADIDYVRGIHTYRVGTQLDAARWRSNDSANYLGTYTFESLTAFEAGTPRSYTRRIGDPNLHYENFQGAVYAQDDVRVKRNLTLSGGVRYEAQTHVEDANSVMPRFGVTWSPGTGGLTTLRASWGIFHDWFSMTTYEQTLRVDGFHQREIDVINPPYPQLGTIEVASAPGNRYQLGGGVALPRSNRVSLGVDHRYKTLQGSLTYAYIRGAALARGVNLNAPVGGVRPNGQFGNVIEVVSDASSRQHTLQANITANPGAMFPITSKSAPRVAFKRTTLFLNYTLGTLRNNTEGAFSIAPLGDQAFEWGPANNDVRHRMNVNVNNQIVKNLTVGFNLNAASAAPYTIRTGYDNNGDLIFNDRPAGVTRNTERAASQFTINMNVGYGWSFGKPVGGPPGIAVFAGGGAPTVQSVDQGARYRIQFFVQAQNLTNRNNYTGYSGTQTSTFFRQATAVTTMRRVESGINFSF
jgi:Carboxypeptidase regulatory-like domain